MPSSYTIGEHYEAFIRDLVATGRYSSASEVLRDGLRLLEDHEALRQIKLEALRKEIQKGLDSGDAGEWNLEEFLAEARRRKAERDAA